MRNLFILSVLLFAGSCSRLGNGPAHLELAAVQASGPSEVRLIFSEPLSPDNADPGLFTLTNASTGETLSLASSAPSEFTLSLKLAPAFVLTAGHVYDVRYDALSRDHNARAGGSSRFLADFLPPDGRVPALSVSRDSSGRILLTWSPENRIGNMALEIWKRSGLYGVPALVSVIEPNRSAFWMADGGEAGTGYALKMVNEFGKSGFGPWKTPEDAGIALFSCFGVCLLNRAQDSLPPGYSPRELTCDRLFYAHDSTGLFLVREVSPRGARELRERSPGRFDTTQLSWCP